jgi:hypothetical protein
MDTVHSNYEHLRRRSTLPYLLFSWTINSAFPGKQYLPSLDANGYCSEPRLNTCEGVQHLPSLDANGYCSSQLRALTKAINATILTIFMDYKFCVSRKTILTFPRCKWILFVPITIPYEGAQHLPSLDANGYCSSQLHQLRRRSTLTFLRCKWILFEPITPITKALNTYLP